MDVWKAVVVGVVQGLSEFLPISSSGHIALTQELLGMNKLNTQPDITFELVLHIGTLLSVVIYFRRRLLDLFLGLFQAHRTEERKTILWLLLATVPATAAYLLFKDFFEGAYDRPVLVGVFLLATGAILLLPKWIRAKEREFGLKQALWMGVAQAFAVLPGISRSGSTITAGLMSGAQPAKAAEFSFLMFLPAIGGGMLLKADALMKIAQSDAGAAYGAGFVAAFVSGIFAVYLVLAAIKRGKLEYFAYYCFMAGLAAILYFSLAR
ncbi:MAG: undecaprenyl-diphosphate phosphatase [Akkermansiaceae bacterium]|nr:undecaprenyl-diphosphate phosphatase [Akkermansiaceae bacterium]NNM29376.1 undecaprenyl-diphosphate phosphatase [Akkermansiaceae bacterium]